MKKWTLALMGIMVLGLLGACGNTTQTGAGNEGNIWRVGTSADFYPFEFIDPDTNEIVGFDIDIINHIADQLGYTVEMVDMDFTGLVPALQSGRLDVVIAGMTPTEERREVVDFTQIYHFSYDVLLTTLDHDIATLEDMNGLVIGGQSTTTQEDRILSMIDDGFDLELMSMNRIPELVQQLLVGRADGVIIERAVVGNYLANHDNLQAMDIFENDGAGAAIALPLGSNLTEKFDAVIDEMRADGTLQAFAEKWFN